jgi:hypothetical protein
LSVYQKGAHYTEIKVFNRLPVPIKQLSHETKQFKMALKGFFVSSFFLLVGRIFQIQYELNFNVVYITYDRLCDLVVRVPGYRSRGPGSIPDTTRFSEKQWVWNGVHSAL